MIDFEQLQELKETKEPFVIATVIKSEGSSPSEVGSSMIVFNDGRTKGTVGGGELERQAIEHAIRFLKEGKSGTVAFDLDASGDSSQITGMVCGGKVEIFFDVWSPPLKLVVFGAGHIGKKLAQISNVLKWKCVVVDDRRKFAEEIKKFGAEAINAPYAKSFDRLDIDNSTAVVIVTHGHIHDAKCLEESLKTKAFYIGMIGSKTKVKLTFDKIHKKGIKIDKRVYSPVGLELGGESPEEIALSIAAAIMKVKNGGSARHLRILPKDSPAREGKNADL